VVKQKQLYIKAVKTTMIKVTVKTLKKGKRIMPNSYPAKLRYLSTNGKIATVIGRRQDQRW